MLSHRIYHQLTITIRYQCRYTDAEEVQEFRANRQNMSTDSFSEPNWRPWLVCIKCHNLALTQCIKILSM